MNDSENGDSGFESAFHWNADASPVEEAAWLILDEAGEPIASIPVPN